MDIDESFVPQEIKDKIEMLNEMIREAESLNEEITEWYHEALLDMDSGLNVDDELFDASNALSVEGIDFNAIMEGLSIVSIFIEPMENEKMDNKCVEKLLETVAFSNGCICSVELIRWEHTHFHPSGIPLPSRDDFNVCRRIRDAGELLGIPLADFIVIGCGDFVSFKEKDLLKL